MRQPLVMACTAALLAACGSGNAPAEAEKTAAAISGDDKTAATDNPQCRMFSQSEIADFAGEAVGPGRNGASGLGCYWLATDNSGVVTVTVAPAEYHVETSEAPGYRPLPGIGAKGFVAGAGTSWTAGAIVGDKALIAGIDAAASTEAKTIKLLETMISKARA